jgi:hypothetical protein
MPVINRETGQPPTEQEQNEIDVSAIKILSSPYSAPEQVAWAMDCATPAIVEEWFFSGWESCRGRAIRQRRERTGFPQGEVR